MALIDGKWIPVLPRDPFGGACGFSEVENCDGAPSNNDGEDGDIFVNNSTGDVYSKASGVWTLVAAGAGGGGGFQDLSGNGSPVGVVTPDVVNQKYRDNLADTYWWATGLTSADWTQFV